MRFNNFNANDHEARNFDAVPAGWYVAIITESESKPTKSGNGTYLQLTLEIIEGECKGRKIWDRLNLENQNEAAVEIAYATLSSICKAINVLTPDDSIELHNQPLMIKVTTREYNGSEQNEVKGYAEVKGGSGNAAPRPAARPEGNRWQPNRERQTQDNGGGGFRGSETYREAR